jgi:hypothetical protein
MSLLQNRLENGMYNIVRDLEEQIAYLNKKPPRESTKRIVQKVRGGIQERKHPLCYKSVEAEVYKIDDQLGKCIFSATSRKGYLECLRTAHRQVAKLDDSIPRRCPDKTNRYRAKVYLGGMWDIRSTIDCLERSGQDKQMVIDCIDQNRPSV